MSELAGEVARPGPEFEKARLWLAVLSFGLGSWEYVGLEVVTEQVASGVALNVRHPEVIPVVIAVAASYAAIRVGLEWRLAPARARRQPAARVDLVMAFTIYLIGLGVFLFQTFGGQQLASRVATASATWFLILTLTSALAVTMAYKFGAEMRSEGRASLWQARYPIAMVVIALWTAFTDASPAFALLAFLIPASVALGYVRSSGQEP